MHSSIFCSAFALVLFSCPALAGFVVEPAAKTPVTNSRATKSPGETATALPVTAASMPATAIWTVQINDKTIRRSMARWAGQAGYSVVWDVSKDISIDTEATFSGSFEDAIRSVLESLSGSEFPVEAILYDNKVIRIVKKAREMDSGSGK